jgi:ribosomal protein S10
MSIMGGNKCIKIKLIANNCTELNQASLVITDYIAYFNKNKSLLHKSSYFAPVKSKQISLPTKERKWCFLKSPHVDKTSREHFSFRTYTRMHIIYVPKNIELELVNFEVINVFPSGVRIACYAQSSNYYKNSSDINN